MKSIWSVLSALCSVLCALCSPLGIGKAEVRRQKEYYEEVEHIHLNPVRAGLVKRAEEWKWSSMHDYTGGLSAGVRARRILASDRVLLLADQGGADLKEKPQSL